MLAELHFILSLNAKMTTLSDDLIQEIVEHNYNISKAHQELQNAVEKLHTKERQNLDEFFHAHQNLKDTLNSFKLPKTSCTSKKQAAKRKESTDKSSSSKKRKSNITLQELEASLNESTLSIASRAKLQQLKSNEEKLTALFRWEREGNTNIIRLAFFQGYYIDLICSKKEITTKELAQQTGASNTELQRKR